MPQTPGTGNSAPGRGFGWDGAAERGWGPQPHLAGAEQGSSEGSTASLARPARGLRQGQEVAALAPRLGPCFLFRCGWDFPALAVGPRSAPAAALFSISKAAEADGFNATAISSVPKAGGPPPPRDPRRAPTQGEAVAEPPVPCSEQGDKAAARIFLEPGLRLFPHFLILFKKKYNNKRWF